MAARSPILRFTLLQAGGMVLLTVSLWAIAASRLDFALSEMGIAVIAAAIAGTISLFAGLEALWQLAFAAGIATLLHMAVYYLPLLYLLGATPNSHLNADMAQTAGWLLICYAVAVGLAVFGRKLLHKRGATK